MDLQKQASKYYWYHSVDLGNGVIIDGDYDIREVLLHYGFPERMDGMDVLDVGRGSGFFAFSSSGGALRSLRRTFALSSIWTSWVAMSSGMRDARPLETSKGLPSSTSPGAFAFAGGARKSRVTSKLINLYEMSPSGVRQPKLRSCLCGIHYFAPPRPDLCIRKAVWVMNGVCLIEVLRCAGFKQVRIVAQFTLPNRCVPSLKVPHLVAHADVQDGSRDGMDFAKGPLGLLDKFESIRMRGY